VTSAKDQYPDISRYRLRVRKKHPKPVPRESKHRRNRNQVHAASWWDRAEGELITLCGITLQAHDTQASKHATPVTCQHCLRVAAGQPRTYGVPRRGEGTHGEQPGDHLAERQGV
jgi:hypothetical protein